MCLQLNSTIIKESKDFEVNCIFGPGSLGGVQIFTIKRSKFSEKLILNYINFNNAIRT